MAKNCTDIKDARRRIKKIMNDASSASPIEASGILLRGFHDLANDALAKLYPEIIDLIKVQADKAGVLPLIGDPSTVFSSKVDINRVVAEAEERIRNLSKYQETIERKAQVKKSFLKSLFGENGSAQEYFLRSAKNGFSAYNENATFGTPGFIDIFFTARHKGHLVTQGEIAENVREAKQELLDKVIDFLEGKGLFTEDISEGKDILFDKDGVYTGILQPETSPIFAAIQKVFNPDTMASGSHLDQLYRDYKKGNKEAQKELEAYNAWVLLNNFDTVLTLQLEDSVIITKPENFNKIGNTDYKTNVEKATNMWSFGFGDDVSDIGELVSSITQELIESSKRYTWKGPAIDDAYIGFKDFNYIIGKIKSLAFTLQSNDIVLDLDTKTFDDRTGKRVSPFDNLSDTTKNIIRRIEQINSENGETEYGGKATLGQVVAFMSENPMRHLHAIFDILCNTNFIDNGILKFEDQEKNLIWSLYKEVFGQDGYNSRSLFDLHHNTEGDTIFPIITQIADSMFAEDTIQYYEDENGVLYAQLLKDFAVQQLRNELAQQIQVQNGYFTPNGIDSSDLDPESAEYQEKAKKAIKAKSFNTIYNVKVKYGQPTNVERKKGHIWGGYNNPTKVQFISSIEIPLKLNNELIGYIKADAGNARLEISPDKARDLWKSKEFKQLIADAIGIDFESDVDFLSAYESTFPGNRGTGVNYMALMQDISSILGTAVFNQTFNNEFVPRVLKETGKPRKQSSLNDLTYVQFNESGVVPRIDPKTGIISIIPDWSKNQLLNHLGQAKAIANNVFASAQVKTGEGTALSSYCLSRLRNSYPYQLVTQNRAKWSASNYMSFVRNRNGLFKGVSSSREMKAKQTVKTSTDMSGVETWSLNFYNDWVAAFVKHHRTNSPVGDGSACFIPTVNSDKGQFDKLMCDLYAESHIPSGEVDPKTGQDIGKRYIDLSDEELITEIRTEFGPFYRNVISNIITENDRLLAALGVNYIHRTENPAQAWKEQLRAISDHFVYPEMVKSVKAYALQKYLQENPGIDLENNIHFREYLTEQWVNNSGMTVEQLLEKYKTIEEVSDIAFKELYGKFYGKIIDGIHETLTAYNKTHTRNPIQLAEHIHYTKGSMGLAVNNTLVALWGRFGATNEEIEEAGIKDLYAKKSEYSRIYELFPALNGKSIEQITPSEFSIIEAVDPKLAESARKAAYNVSQHTTEGYFKAKDLEMTLKLLKDGCKIYLSGPKARVQDETDFLRKLDGGKWVTNSGMMAFTRVEDLTTHKMVPTNSVFAINEARKNGLKIEINPMISKLNKMDYLTTQQYVCCVGGAHYVYKGKSGANVLEEEANRWLASNKRNVCYASTVHKFQNKVLNGAPTVYNYAIIDDIDAALYNIMGELKSHTPIDGGMLVNSFMPELENNSLGGEAAGTDKKHFATFYFEQYGAGGITKTAGFAATNERMRNSEDWRILQENMSNRKWIKEFSGVDGDILEEIDITKDYNGNDINWQDKNIFYYREQEDGTNKFYRLAKVVKTENPNEYAIYELEVDKYGNDTQTVPTLRAVEVIDNNWVMFNDIFGGYRSLGRETNHHGVENPNSALTYSERSRKLMVEAINRIGYRKTRENAYQAINKYGDKFIAYNVERTKEEGQQDDQDDVWQPLKYSDVHFTPNIGAIKSTQMNVNPSEAMSERMDLNIMTVKMAQLGIQLDKEHHADESELSMPTQIITACANKGFTLTKTTELYEALSNLTEIAIEDCMDGIMDLLPEGEHKGTLQAKIAEIIVDKLIYSKDDNEALHAVMQHLEEKRKAGNKLTPEDVKGSIPWSDTVVYNKIYSDLATHLTNQAIKLKISGSLAVICPTHHIERLYGNKRLSSLVELIPGGKGEAAAIRAYQEQMRKDAIYDRTRDSEKSHTDLLNQASKIDTQHIYNLEYINPLTGQLITKTITVNYPQQYWQIKEALTKFRRVTREQLKGALASTSRDGTINITDVSEINVEEFFTYISGEYVGPDGLPTATSKQKRSVFAQLATDGYTQEELRRLIGNDPNKARMFLLFHELSHKQNNDYVRYPRNNNGKLDLMNKRAIDIEARATKDAWNKMLEIEQNGGRAEEYLLEVAEINSIYENVTEGRELSAYNVRFKALASVVDGVYTPEREFCMYDLDSLRLLFEVVNDVMPKKGPGIDDIKQFGKNRLATFKGIVEYVGSEPLLYSLKSDIQRIYEDYMAKKYPELWNNYKNLDKEYKRLQKLASQNPENTDLAKQRNAAYQAKQNFLDNSKEVVEAYKNALKVVLKQKVQKDLFALSTDYKGDRTIMSQGKLYKVDGASIKTIAYELIMPKIYKTIFGLKEHDDLQAILADKDFFAKRAISKLKKTIADDNLYDYQLKRFSGDHLYILDSRKGIPDQLRPHPDFHLFAERDGSYSRTDIQGNVIYPLSSNSDTVMITEDGTEVIVTSNPQFFIENNIFNTATFSNSRVTEEELQNLIDRLKDSVSKNGEKFKRLFANRKGQLKKFEILKKRNKTFEDLQEDTDSDTNSSELNNIIAEIYKEGRKVHASFNKSLDIIAGRVPAQSQQSFMTQRVVAFGDSDVNAAYVSTFQLFIQGSDLDIDTVNLIGAGFDRNGHYVMWSPYANIESEALIQASEHLPFPTGKSTEITYNNEKGSFFATYNKYFGQGKLFDSQRDYDTGEILVNEKGVPVIGINTESPEVINQLAQFIREVKKTGLNLKGIYGEDRRWHYSKELDSEIYEQGLKFKNYSIFTELGIKPTQLHDILLQIQKIVDDHNLYIKRVGKNTKELMAKNLAYYQMYSVAADPSNQTEGQESIDGPTSLIKGKGGAVEVAMTDEDKYDITSNNEKLSGPDPATKSYSLATGQIGKQGVSIGAKGTQGNSVVQFAIDYILNSDMDDSIKERILLPKDKKGRAHSVVINGQQVQVPRRGYYINGKWRSAIANIHDKTGEQSGISLQTSLDILGMLADLDNKNEIPLNAATSIAAMLSVAVDNAKDLALGKINAGPQMFGMYVYGLTLGMDIIELAKIMNSPQGKAIAKALQGNIFTGDQGSTSVASAIKFLNGDTIGRYLLDYDFRMDKITKRGQQTASFYVNSDLKSADTASKALQYALEEAYKKNTGKLPPRKFQELILELVKTKALKNYLRDVQKPGTHFAEMIKTIQTEGPSVYPRGQEWIESTYQLIEWLEEYSDLYDQWNADSFRQYDLKTLSEGADEMKRLGTMLGSNKGVKSKIEDGQNFINTIEESIIKRKEALGEKVNPDDRIDFVLFCANPEYREQCIQKYENVKHSINILQVVAVTPHMFSYLRTCAIPYAGFMDASSRYRSSQAMIRDGAYTRVGAVSSQEKTSANKGLNNAINATMMIQWLSDTQKKFVLPAGQAYFEEGTSDAKIATNNMPIALWTPEGLATFKMYMESYIIPIYLKKNPVLRENKFIKGLTPFSLSQTGTRATVQAYTLTGDMMAKEGSALDAQVKEYRTAFKAMGNEKFPMSSKRFVKEGSTIGNMQDAFYLYSEYVFGGRKGPRSLMTMFDDGTSELQKEFRVAKAAMDSSRDFILTKEQQIRAMAQNSTIYSAKYPYYYGTDVEEIGVRLYRNDDKLLSTQEKMDIMQENPEAIISKATPFSLKSESGKGELQAQYFLYPQLQVTPEVRTVGNLDITYNDKKFLSWEVTPKFLQYYEGKNMSEQELHEQMIKDADAIDDAIDAINKHMGVMSSAVYDNGKITIEVKNLDILRAAIEMSLKHSRGEC